jgi:hypothetical protein
MIVQFLFHRVSCWFAEEVLNSTLGLKKQIEEILTLPIPDPKSFSRPN